MLVQLDQLICQIQTDQIQRQHEKTDEVLAFSIFNSNAHYQGQSSMGLNGPFIYSQLLIDSLIRMESSSDEKQELLSLCKQQYKNNADKLQIVNEFERDYSADRSLWWYTRETFLYQLLNKALRVQNINVLYAFRFFIRDLGQQLEKNKCSTRVYVYRGQRMSKEEIDMLKNSVGEYISMNSFLSTSLNREQAREFICSPNHSEDIEKVFFEIDADPQLDHIKPFSNITPFSFFHNEEEVLFMIGSIFRLVEIQHESNGVWNIRMTLCSENEHQLQSLFQHMKNELDTEGINLLRFGHILRRMSKFNDAEKYYRRYLNQLPSNHPHISNCYNALGKVTDAKGDYDSSLNWYNKSLEIDMKTLEPDHLNVAATHNSIAIVHSKKGDYTRALESYEKALMILQKAHGEDHPRVAECFNNIGGIYENEKNYSKALEYHQKALVIRQKHLPADHPHLASSYSNIGNIDRHLGHYDQALEHYHLSLEIKSKSLPPQHPDLAMTLENIGLVYEDKRDFQQAFSYFDKAAKIYRHSLPPTHPNVINIDQRITRVSSKFK